MKVHFLTFLTILFIATNLPNTVHAQDIENDATVLFMKANVLYQASRYDEAVRMYNRILNDDASFVNAYVMRARAKYDLGAYKGTKQDIMEYIERAGVTKEVIKLMIDTEYRLNNMTAAKNYLATAIELDRFDGDLHYQAGVIALEEGNRNNACESFSKGASLDHPKAKEMFESECYDYVEKAPRRRPRRDTGDVDTQSDTNNRRGKNRDEERRRVPIEEDDRDIFTEEDEPVITELPEEKAQIEEPVDLTAVQEHKVDDNLTLQINNGLGDRNLEHLPNIFILSTEDGVVVIDVCVDASGKVIESTFNREESTIFRSSLTSLALRKSREFEFSNANRAEQCGKIVYRIKA
jgi:tetratricopeptide (TPR) repeat protein